MASEADSLISEIDRAPIDNRQSEPILTGQSKDSSMGSSTAASEDPPIPKKKRHGRKAAAHKDKRPRDHNDLEIPSTSGGGAPSGLTSTSPPPSTNSDAQDQGDAVVIAPEVLTAIRSSLRDDLFLICQQVCKQAMDTTDANSSASSITTSSSHQAGTRPKVHTQPRGEKSQTKTETQPRNEKTQKPLKRSHDQQGVKQRTWLTKTARKHLSQQQITEPDEDDYSDEEVDDEEEDAEHFSSDEDDEQEADQDDSIARFFNAEDYQQLLTKCLSALDLKDKPPEGDSPAAAAQKAKGAYVHPNNMLWGSGDYFPKRKTSQKVFPFPIFFEEQLRAAWETPATYRRPPPAIRKLYALPKFTEDFLKVPKIDAPILDIQSSGLLSEDGQGSIRDGWDKHLDQDLKRVYETSASTIGSSATASIVARASIVWTKKLLDLIPQSDSRLQEGLNRLLKANAFVADATLDSLVFTSRSMAASVHARRALWLRAWQADNRSKQILAAYPFTGETLFGPKLEKILVETRDKRKALPKSLRRNDRRGKQTYPSSNFSFRSSFANRSRTEGRRPSWTPKPRFRRSYTNTREGRPPFTKPQDRAFRQDGTGMRKQRKA